MPSGKRDPGPGDRDGSFTVGQSDEQQLMSTASLGTIHNQTDPCQTMKLRSQLCSGNRLVPHPHPDSWIAQQSAQSPNSTQELSFSRHLSGNLAQGHRLALVDLHQHPDEVTHLSDPFSRSMLLNSPKPITYWRLIGIAFLQIKLFLAKKL